MVNPKKFSNLATSLGILLLAATGCKATYQPLDNDLVDHGIEVDVGAQSDADEGDVRDVSTEPDVQSDVDAQDLPDTSEEDVHEGGDADVSIEEPTPPSIDILWVIDNSATMCHRQHVVQDSFLGVAERLMRTKIDFHIAITTTHMATIDEYPFEPVAKPGHLQSTPQPIPGFSPDCFYTLDAQGDPILGDPDNPESVDQTIFSPILRNIEIAVGCTENPQEWTHLLAPDVRRLQCAFDSIRWSCDASESVNREELFPPTEAYRDIPKVLRAEDYLNASGDLDVNRLNADFVCASLVGTRGYGFEKGLSAAVTALSTDLTGQGKTNEGFLRPDARTSIIFVSDENDCSHDGTLDERTACGVSECTFSENTPDGPLLAITDLKTDLIDNLSDSKGRAISESELLVASFHAESQRYIEPRPEQCDGASQIPTSCSTALGKGYSGHRYDAFIRQFPNHFPPLLDENDEYLPGLVCDDFRALVWVLGDILSEVRF